MDIMNLCDNGYHRSLGNLLERLDEIEVPINDDGPLCFLSLYSIDWTRPVGSSIARRDKAICAKVGARDCGTRNAGLPGADIVRDVTESGH